MREKIRDLEKQVRNLIKELSYYKKRDHINDVLPDDEPEEVQDHRITCQECGKGKFDVMEIIGRIYGTCNVCGFRKRLDKNETEKT